MGSLTAAGGGLLAAYYAGLSYQRTMESNRAYLVQNRPRIDDELNPDAHAQMLKVVGTSFNNVGKSIARNIRTKARVTFLAGERVLGYFNLNNPDICDRASPTIETIFQPKALNR